MDALKKAAEAYPSAAQEKDTFERRREIPLCSQGLLYQNLVPDFDGAVAVKALETRDEKVLGGSKSESFSLTNWIIGRYCELPAGLAVLDLIPADRFQIVLAVRMLSFGKAYRYSVPCENCNDPISGVYDLTTISVHRPDAEGMILIGDDDVLDLEGNIVDPIRVPLQEPFETALPDSGLRIGWVLLRGHDIARLRKKEQEFARKGQLGDQFGDPTHDFRMAYHVRSIDDKDVEFPEALALFRQGRISAGDSLVLRNAIDGVRLGPDLRIKKSCPLPACGWPNEFSIPFGLEFFRPGCYSALTEQDFGRAEIFAGARQAPAVRGGTDDSV